MGMYTELVFKAEIRTDIPDGVHAVLRHLFSGGPRPDTDLPDHPFFECSRWAAIGSCSSYYHIPFSLSRYEDPNHPGRKGGYIFSRSDLKNYSDEIGQFLHWIDPYIDEEPGHCIGWEWYEEEDQPTLIFKQPKEPK